MQMIRELCATIDLPNLPEKVKTLLPHRVAPKSRVNEQEKRLWCRENFGEWATRGDANGAWYLDNTARWDILGDYFYFREEKDAVAFKMFWG